VSLGAQCLGVWAPNPAKTAKTVRTLDGFVRQIVVPKANKAVGTHRKQAEDPFALVSNDAPVWGSVRDERTVTFMDMVTGDQRNSLTTYLELCVRFGSSRCSPLTTFSFVWSIKLT
jgi:hypothetical protein